MPTRSYHGRPHYFRPDWIATSDQTIERDVCIYGGTSAGIIAAVAAARRGRSVIVLNPGLHLGGLTTGGLGHTDFGNKAAIGGLSRDFYRRVGAKYGRGEGGEEWHFEPHIATAVFDDLIEEHDLDIRPAEYLHSVQMDRVDGRTRIAGVRTLGGLTVRARQFIDASYEGDLLARAGVSYTVGRESNATHGETLNGVQARPTHQFSHAVDPYVTPGDPASGTLPDVQALDAPPEGSGDGIIQAYCFRVCMSDDPASQVPFEKPADYDPARYELLRRWLHAEHDPYNETLRPNGTLAKFDGLCVRHKTDTNNHGPVSSDYIGGNWAWPEADYAARERIFQDHVSYQRGLEWARANDPGVPQRYRDAFGRWGLAADEFEETDYWPPQLYIREARRMVSDYIITEHDCLDQRRCKDSVGMGAYAMDSHNCRRFVRDGRVLNEGDVQVKLPGPYPVSYRSIVPRKGECENLTVPVCLSASHIAFGSVRMEPVFMLLAESAAIAVDLCLGSGRGVQDLPYDELRPELERANQVLAT